MKRLMQLTAAFAMTLAVVACDNARRTDTGSAVGTTGRVDADRGFVEEQLAMGAAEVELGRLAQEKATHPDVKEFAAVMVRDHQNAVDELKKIAAKPQGTIVARSDDDYREVMDDLSKLSGREFDKKYIAEMIDDHQEGVEDLEARSANADNPEVKAWATKTLPTMRQHLERAKAIKETLDRAEEH